jgi:cytochrome c biogenesis protein CcdA
LTSWLFRGIQTGSHSINPGKTEIIFLDIILTIIAITIIAIVDAMLMLPGWNTFVLVPLLITENPFYRAVGFIAGLFTTYIVGGLLVIFGLQWLIDLIAQFIAQFLAHLSQLPASPAGHVVQFLLGLGLLIGGLAMLRGKPKTSTEKSGWFATKLAEFTEQVSNMGFTGGLMLGIGTQAAQFPLALPLFLAINLMLKTNWNEISVFMGVLYYSTIAFSPFVGMVAFRLMNSEKSELFLSNVRHGIAHWSLRIGGWALILLGAWFMADSALFLILHRPIIPVETTSELLRTLLEYQYL